MFAGGRRGNLGKIQSEGSSRRNSAGDGKLQISENRIFMISQLRRLLAFVATHSITKPSSTSVRLSHSALAKRELDSQRSCFSCVEGTRLFARRGMTGATGNSSVGLHEFAELAFALHKLGCGDLLVDVGAKIGNYPSRRCGQRRRGPSKDGHFEA